MKEIQIRIWYYFSSIKLAKLFKVMINEKRMSATSQLCQVWVMKEVPTPQGRRNFSTPSKVFKSTHLSLNTSLSAEPWWAWGRLCVRLGRVKRGVEGMIPPSTHTHTQTPTLSDTQTPTLSDTQTPTLSDCERGHASPHPATLICYGQHDQFCLYRLTI